MAVIQQVLVDRVVSYLDEIVQGGRVQLNGVFVNYAVHKTVKDGGILRKYLYLETETGFVGEAQLLSANNEVLAKKTFDINKSEDGLVLAFEFNITIQEA